MKQKVNEESQNILGHHCVLSFLSFGFVFVYHEFLFRVEDRGIRAQMNIDEYLQCVSIRTQE